MTDKIQIDSTEISVTKAVIVILTIGAGIIGVFNTVILPLSNIQLSLTQIQSTLADNKTQFNNFNAEQIAQNARITLLESEIKDLTNKVITK